MDLKKKEEQSFKQIDTDWDVDLELPKRISLIIWTGDEARMVTALWGGDCEQPRKKKASGAESPAGRDDNIERAELFHEI